MFCLSRKGSGAVSRMAPLAGFAAAVGMCLGTFVVATVPAQAQIASYVDAHGRVVYVNAYPPARGVRHSTERVFAPPARLKRIADAAAKRNHLDPALVEAVIRAESDWNPFAVSDKGAFGLMQLMPSTAERYGVKDVFDPAENVSGGTRYLRDLLERYHGNLKNSLAAYNAGEGAVARFGGVPDYRETRNYVRKVTNTYFQTGSGQPFDGRTDDGGQIREVRRDGRLVFTNE